MRTRALTVLGLATVLSATVLTQSGPRRDGKWEVTVKMEMPGMPMQLPASTTTQCITKEQANDPNRMAPPPPSGRGRGNPEACKVSDYKVEGNKVTYAMACGGDMPMTGTGEFLYKGDTYEGVMMMNMSRGGAPMAMTMKYAGKRLGDCTESQ